MKKQIVVEYDMIENSVRIGDNDFTTFEAFGVLEAAKVMISRHWYDEDRDTEETV